jgi:hypothetical protein
MKQVVDPDKGQSGEVGPGRSETPPGLFKAVDENRGHFVIETGVLRGIEVAGDDHVLAFESVELT